MKGGDPFERTWLEIKILSHLNDSPHPMSLRTMRDGIEPNMQESIVCSVFDLRDDGLVVMRELVGDHMVDITSTGRAVLSAILSGRSTC